MTHLVAAWGYWAVALFVLAESCGVPLPGETAIIVAGVYAGQTNHLSPVGIFVAATVAAIAGGQLGYLLGRFGGLRLVQRFGHRVRLDEAKLRVGRYLFDLHGWKVVFFGRFVSILRTYAALLAGMNEMRPLPFASANAAGAVTWAGAFSVAAYVVGGALQRDFGTITWGLVATAVLILAIVPLVSRRSLRRLADRAAAAYPLDGIDPAPAVQTASSLVTAATPPLAPASSQTEPPEARTS